MLVLTRRRPRQSAKYEGMKTVKDAKYAGMIMKKRDDKKMIEGREGRIRPGEEGEGYCSSVMGLEDLFDR